MRKPRPCYAHKQRFCKEMADFDSLPDGVICLIFSMLGLAQTVAQCAMVCRRWKNLSQIVDTLTFESFQLFENRAESKRKASSIEAVVSSMLLKTNGVRDLKIAYHPVVWPWIDDDHFSEKNVCTWIQHVKPSLEKLTLVDPNRTTPQPGKLIHLSDCKRLQWLNICYGSIPNIPLECHPFSLLKTCFLDLIVITDSALMDFVQLCPLLEDLTINSCPGLQSPHIRAENLKCLEFLNNLGNVAPIQRLCVNAPKLVKASLSYVKELVTEGDGISALVLMCHVKPRIQSMPSLNSLYMHGQNWELDSISEYIRLATSLQQLHIDVKLEAKHPLRIDRFLGQLQHLNSLYIGSDFFKVWVSNFQAYY